MDIVIALAPPIGVGLLFYLLMRIFLTADRRERAAQAKIDAEVERRINANPPATPPPGRPE
ncbi:MULTISPECIES: hypothetical protein [unclassified Pseudactinotalea]|uniref:hypothetical protein n=1 Tax=unclassified Pseudactinotalea TaxID=2649176 RepID=UPI00128C48D0|nr:MULTISPECIES: hypothetical protein [unclassified Pseudactinotalea]MPV48436.1 hypothetical protein [Pseudactinotalea sp. HY160]QGH68415.1 hypothetical protein GCE65_02010 [Pseudactinotalea sp. HY158]